MTHLERACAGDPLAMAWLEALPAHISRLTSEWGLILQDPIGEEASCSWVAPGVDGSGRAVVLKLGMPHMEARDEARALRLWSGDGAVRLLRHDSESGAMLLERLQPGYTLRKEEEPVQDEIIAGLLKRVWTHRPPPGEFRHLSEMINVWMASTKAAIDRWTDPERVREGLAMMTILSTPADDDVLLVTDLHAGNVLRANTASAQQGVMQDGWCIIDPKPFIGDPAYDATQHLLNCHSRMADRPLQTIGRMADALGLERARVRAWTFARAAAESCRVSDPYFVQLALTISP